MVYVEALLDELDAISLTVRSCRPVERSACPLLSSPPTSDELTAAADTPSAHVAATWMQHSGSAHQSSRLLLLVLACSTVDDLLFTTRRRGRFWHATQDCVARRTSATSATDTGYGPYPLHQAVLYGAHPCDAGASSRSPPVLSHSWLFSNEYRDDNDDDDDDCCFYGAVTCLGLLLAIPVPRRPFTSSHHWSWHVTPESCNFYCSCVGWATGRAAGL